MSTKKCSLCGKIVTKLTHHIANNHSLVSTSQRETASLIARKQRSNAKIKNSSRLYVRCAYTLSRQKYLNIVKYTCANFVIYRLYNELYSKMRIDIYKYRKYVVLALTSMKFLQVLVFHEVLIY